MKSIDGTYVHGGIERYRCTIHTHVHIGFGPRNSYNKSSNSTTKTDSQSGWALVNGVEKIASNAGWCLFSKGFAI